MKRRQRRIVIWILLTLFIAYVNSYFVLSRRGMAEMPKYGQKQFFYCRGENLASNDPAVARSAARFHNFCVGLFAPLNYLDAEIFGGTYAAFPITDIP